MAANYPPLEPPHRLLMGPGPSPVHPDVLQSLALPPLGHLDPALLEIMDRLQQMLREAFRTKNKFAIALSGTGTAGMEAAFRNAFAPGETVLVGVHGYFGTRMCDMVQRFGGNLARVDAEWGTRLDINKLREAIQQHKPRGVAVVHAETSTGVLQPLEEIIQAAHEVDALVIADTVTSLGGMPVEVDKWGIDICYSGSQKCLGAPSGLSPFTMNERAIERVKQRGGSASYYLDEQLLADYWEGRQYHHTISAPLIFAFYTALRMLSEEGLENRWQRHHLQHRAFRAGCEALGLPFLPPEEISLWSLNAVNIPAGLDDIKARTALREHHNIEIGGGMGPLKGKIWRVGLMGYGARQECVLELLGALELMLGTHEHKTETGAGLTAAMGVYAEAAAGKVSGAVD